jgi:hypothetical protein
VINHSPSRYLSRSVIKLCIAAKPAVLFGLQPSNPFQWQGACFLISGEVTKCPRLLAGRRYKDQYHDPRRNTGSEIRCSRASVYVAALPTCVTAFITHDLNVATKTVVWTAGIASVF